jgi:hypothetical protein
MRGKDQRAENGGVSTGINYLKSIFFMASWRIAGMTPSGPG